MAWLPSEICGGMKDEPTWMRWSHFSWIASKPEKVEPKQPLAEEDEVDEVEGWV